METKKEIRRTSTEIRGGKWMMFKLAEECSELAAAILQHFNKDSVSINGILSEIADVEIAIDIIKDMHGSGFIASQKELKYEAIKKANDKWIAENGEWEKLL